MSREIFDVVEEAYRIFAPYTIGSALVVCRCPCCMTVETERELTRTPLRKIPSGLLAEYTNSAHGWDDGQIAREQRYFLPRYLELIAAGDPPDHMGLDICLRRLGEAGWRSKWPRSEIDVLERFFDALMGSSVSKLELVHWPAGWRLGLDLKDVLTLAVTAGADIGRVLGAWDKAADPAAALHMAALRRDIMIESGRTYLHSPYLEDHPSTADEIGAFLMRPEVGARIEASFFAVEDPRLQQILSDMA